MRNKDDTSSKSCKLWGGQGATAALLQQFSITHNSKQTVKAVTICTAPTTRTFSKCVETFLVVTTVQK